MSYGFNNFKNLEFRHDNLTGQKEVFSYDNLNRLTAIDYYLSGAHQSGGDRTITYDNSGNITGKTGVAAANDIKYGENSFSPHALTSISNAGSYAPANQQISYTIFNKVEVITDTLSDKTTRKLEFKYGFDQQRKRSTYTQGSATVKKYFFGDYEETEIGGTTKKYHYISSPTGLCGVYVIEGTNTRKLYHVFTDHLGSITEVVDATTGVVTKQSFDAWGNKRSVTDWRGAATYTLFAERGYTGHQHLEAFDLINMNGRVYDPVLGRFLSPDPYVQLPDYSQSYNRYSYCFNNPMIYTDPSGLRTFYGERGYDGEPNVNKHRKLDCDGTGGFGAFMDAWREAVDKGYAGSCAEFRELYDRQVNKPNFNGTITLQTGWMDYFSQGIVYGEKGPLGSYINSEPTFSTIRVDYFGGNPPNVVPGGGGNQPGRSNTSNGLSIVEERFAQITGILGISGPTAGISIAKLPNGKFAVYWNIGNSSGADLPNIDFGKTFNISSNTKINWALVLSGKSTKYSLSFLTAGVAIGGNQDENDHWSFGKDYINISYMGNFGFNDWAGGLTKNTTYQTFLFYLPKWLGW